MPRLTPGSRFALAVVTITCAFVLLGGGLAWRVYANDRQHQIDATAQLANTAGLNADRFLRDRLDILTAMAYAPPVRSGDLPTMLAYFESLNPERIGFGGGIGWVDRNGWIQVYTGADPAALPVYIGDREHVQAVLSAESPYVGEAIVGRGNAYPLLPFAVPTYDVSGQFSGVLVGTIRLDLLEAAAKEQRFGTDAVTIVDRSGNVVARPGRVTELVNVAGSPLLAQTAQSESGLLEHATGFAGDDNRVIGFAKVPTGDWTVFIDRSADDLYGGARRTFILEVTGLAALLLAVGVGALSIGRRINRAAQREAAALKQLEIREARLRSLTEATTQVIWTVGPNGELRDPEQRWSALTGCPIDQLDPDDWLASVPNDDRVAGNDIWMARIAAGAMIEFEQRVTRHDGQLRQYLVRAVPVREADGRIREWIGVDIDVTEQRRAEAALRERETFARDVIDSLFAFVGVMTPDGILIEANRAALLIAGLREEDVLNWPFWEAYWWSYDSTVQEQVRDAIQRAIAGEIVRYDADVRIGENRFLTIDFAIGAIRDDEGRIRFLVPSATDITERTRAERAVAESEERHRALVEATSTVVWRATAEGQVVYAGDAWERITGQSLDEMAGTGWVDMVHPDDRERAVATWMESIRSQSTHVDEFRLRQRDGTYRYYAVRAVPLFNADSSVREWVGANTDIHDRHRAEESLRETADRLSLALDAGQLDTWDWDIQADRVIWSETANATIGPTPLDFENFIEGVHPEDQARVREAVRRSLEERAPYEVEYRAVGTDGAERWLYVRGEAFHDAEGRPLRMLGVDVDVTERKNREAFEQDFIANVAHDIKNPLAAVKAQTQLLRRRLKNGRADLESMDSVLGVLDSGLTRMNRRIEELADVARLRAGRELELRKEPVNLGAMVRGIIESYQQGTERHTFALTAPEPDLVGMVDGGRIERVIDNLVSNAMKYSPEGGEIRVNLDRSGDVPNRVRLSVIDHGIGIPASDLPYIFERYRRAGNTAVITGTGVGLAGSRHIVEQHGGTIQVESREGAGSTFTVFLPLTESGSRHREWQAGEAIVPAGQPGIHEYAQSDDEAVGVGPQAADSKSTG